MGYIIWALLNEENIIDSLVEVGVASRYVQIYAPVPATADPIQWVAAEEYNERLSLWSGDFQVLWYRR